ncbi:MAG: phenylalanine--tRNA ligase subunit alpha [Actinomycetota bacterium]
MTPEEARARLEEIRAEGLVAADRASELGALREVEVRFLGRKGPLARIVGELGRLPAEARREVGRMANEVRSALEGALGQRRDVLEASERTLRMAAERVDVTLPGRRPVLGRLHPISQVTEEIVDIFVGLGFKVAEGPEVESDYYSFEALNMPPDHPARSVFDTLYLEPGVHGQALFRPHTSPVQIRVMESRPPPLYVVIPGRCARRDVPDPTHLTVFQQVEGLAVDEGISFADLKGTLEAFAKGLFGAGQRVRTIPHYFPFTEPSAEVLVSCFRCDGSGCRTCGGEGWIEIMGAGMVHPNVFRAVGYDPGVTGFAFGMGVERIAMLRYSIPDMRWLYENDLRFLGGF